MLMPAGIPQVQSKLFVDPHIVKAGIPIKNVGPSVICMLISFIFNYTYTK